MLSFGLRYDLIQQTDNLSIASGVATRKRRREEGKALVAALIEEVFVLYAIVLCGVEGIQPL